MTLSGKRLKSRTLGEQDFWMKKLFPQFRYKRDNGYSVWIGKLIPSSIEYTIKIKYKLKHNPIVHVLSPKILPDAPHIYRKNKNALCLYYPRDNSWSSEKIIAKTIVPWSVEWLRYYEIWQVTGEWFGPEAPHSPNK